MRSGQKHIVIFSHGFGVRQDARGMFTDIARALPGAELVMFDYNTYDEAARTVTVRPLKEQAKILVAQVKQARESHPGAFVDLICHSQGAVVAGLARLESLRIRKALLLAPPVTMSFERMLANFQSRPGTVIDLQGMSRLARRDGSFTLVPAAYFAERAEIDPLRLYPDLSRYTDVIIIKAGQDEILGATDFSTLPSVRVVELAGDHDFTGEARQTLVRAIQQELL